MINVKSHTRKIENKITRSTIRYPTVEEVIETNRLAVNELKVSSKDYFMVRHEDYIRETIKAMKRLKGDIYLKAVYLLKNLIIKHPFASANRRTAYIVVNSFLWENLGEVPYIRKEKAERTLESIRHGWLTDKKVKLWLQGKTGS